MNWLDILIIVVLAVSTLGGWRTGLIRAALGWIGIIVGIIVAGDYYPKLAQAVSTVLQGELARIVSFLAILGAIILIAYLAGIWLEKVVSVSLLGWVNRLLGAAFGLLAGAVIVGALTALYVKFVGMPGTVVRSTLAPLLLDRFPLVLALLPDEFDKLRSFFR